AAIEVSIDQAHTIAADTQQEKEEANHVVITAIADNVSLPPPISTASSVLPSAPETPALPDPTLIASTVTVAAAAASSLSSHSALNKRMWTHLYDNLSRSLNELFFLCHISTHTQSSKCKQVLLLLAAAQKDFSKLQQHADVAFANLKPFTDSKSSRLKTV